MTSTNTNLDLHKLAKNGLTVLRLQSKDWESIRGARYEGTRFSWVLPHGSASDAKRRSVSLISVQDDPERLLIAFVRSRQAVGTLHSRIVFDLVTDILPSSLHILLKSIKESSLQAGVKRFSSTNLEFFKISPKLAIKLLEEIFKIDENQWAIQRIMYQLNVPRRNDNARALQLDALRLALKAFGAQDADELILQDGETALASVRVHEDAVIAHDAHWLPDWYMQESQPTGRAVFTHGQDRLEVITANKMPLEELFGVDLIYLNERQESLVMVQYKMMEQEDKKRFWQVGEQRFGESEWTVRIDDQFRKELDRMRKFDIDLEASGAYRLNTGAFFFKLVKRNSDVKSSGLILSLGHLDWLMQNGSFAGTRGGLKISYSRLNGHYVRSDGFVELIRSGYIGTRGATTIHLQQLINTALRGGRAIVAAIQSVIPEGQLVPKIRKNPDDDFKPFEVPPERPW